VNLQSLKLLVSGRFSLFFNAINAWFLLSVFGGIAVSIFSLAKLMKWLLTSYPVPVWSFFFGLILTSAFFVLKTAGKLKINGWIAFLFGIIISYFITAVSPVTTPEALWFIFLCGAIGICAMILPGISGAFILLLLGKYLYIMTAVTDLNLPVIIVFVAGAAIGLILFSNLLSWFLKSFHTVTIAILAGFMIGSLNKVWPWKVVLTSMDGTHGEIIPITEKNVLPGLYSSATGIDSQLIYAIALFLAGILLLFVIESISKKVKQL